MSFQESDVLAEDYRLRRPNLSEEECRTILDKNTSRPVILTDVIKRWPAWQRWTPEFLRQYCGSDSVILSDDLAEPTQFKKTTLATYLDYMENPSDHRFTKQAPGVTWYAGYYSPFKAHPELLEDFTVPECLNSWFQFLEPPMDTWYSLGFGWLLIGPAGTSTAPHFDILSTHAWTAQLLGRKSFTFYPPDRKEPFDDVERVMQQEPLEVVLEPGELLIVPADWCHGARSLEPSFTLTFNFVNETNFSRFLHATYLYPNKWEAKVKSRELREFMGLPVEGDGSQYGNAG